MPLEVIDGMKMGSSKNIKVGLALGAGSARGLAHLGVLQVLQEEGVPVHLVAGSSIGAVAAAFLALGSDLHLLGRLVTEFDVRKLLDLQVPRLGFVAGQRIYDFLHLLTAGKSFEDLKIPLAVVATDLESGERVVLREGKIVDALRASISVPGVFQPCRLNGRWLIDGAVADRLPIGVVREMGADVIIGVDVTFGKEEVKVENILDVFLQAIELLERQIHLPRLSEADVIIQPAVGQVGSTRFDLAEELIARGREAAKAALPLIWEQLGCRGFSLNSPN